MCLILIYYLCGLLQAFGPVSQMAEGVVVQLGCINQGFSNSDLETLQLPLDSLEDIANCGWNNSQVDSQHVHDIKHLKFTP